MGDAFTQSLVQKTSPEPYHQLLILSQSCIDNSFKNMWLLAPPTSSIRSFSQTTRDGQSMTGQLNAPSIQLHVTTLFPQLYFYLNFSSGTMSLYESTDPNDNTMKHFDMTGWVFVFPVSLGNVPVTDSDPNYQSYKDRMGDPAGEFTLAQLLIDVSSAAAWDEQLSKFGTTVWANETPAIQAGFEDFVNNWVNLMSAEKKTVMGITLQTTQPSTVNEIAPTFPPTSLDLANYPWLDPSVTSPQAADGLDQNALCYLMMTGNTAPPNPALLPTTGTWVNSMPGQDGMLCMETSQFWAGWLLPLLTDLNRITEIQPTTPVCSTDKSGDCTVAPRLTVGFNNSHPNSGDAYFNFKPSGSNPPVWTWSGDQLICNGEDKAGVNGALSDLTVGQTSQASSKLVFDAGGQGMTMTGSNSFVFSVHQTGMMSGPFKTESSFTINVNWTLKLALAAVNDGGLQISVISPTSGQSPCTITTENSNSGMDWDIDWGTYTTEISSYVDSWFSSDLGSVENNLIDALAHQHQLFLPASGTFLMMNACFNDRGDLLAGMTYNGAPAPGEDVRLPDHIQKLPPRKALNQVLPASRPREVTGPLIKKGGKASGI